MALSTSYNITVSAVLFLTRGPGLTDRLATLKLEVIITELLMSHTDNHGGESRWI